ncbi:MAG: efflux transporter outer membrane subunit [Desulfobacterales bacterium]
MRKKRWRVLILITLVLTGCMVGPDFVPPTVETPADYRFDAGKAAAEVNLKWWELFKDPILFELVTTSLVNNRDVLIAAGRIEEARAVLGFVGADRYPGIFIEGDASTGNFLGISKSDSTDQAAFIGPTLNWEIDFWGKFRRATESARAELLASEYALRTVQLGLISEVASTYNRLLDFHQRLQISRKTLQSRLKTLDIIQQRFDKGIVPELDLNQAQIQKEIAAASIPQFERQVAQSENALSILLGQLPAEIPIGKGLEAQVAPPEIPVGLPATLLERRPDVAEAFYLLQAQTEQIGVAEALRLPAVSLNGLVGLAGSDIADETTDGGVWRAGAGLFGPLFEFGKNLRRVEIEESRARQTLFFYENTVLTAFREVEDALVQIDTYNRQVEAVSRQVAAARNANTLSLDRYDQGVTSYLEVLETERQYFSAELDLSDLYQQRLNAYVALYKALGGGWMTPEEMQSAK